MIKTFPVPRFFFAPLLFWIGGLLFLSGCSDDRYRPDIPSDGGDTSLTFSVDLPTKVRTYALDEEVNENNISHMYVLAFSWSKSKYTLADWASASGSSIQNNGQSSAKKFTLTFSRLRQNQSYKFVLLANSGKEVDALFNEGLTAGVEREAFLSRLQLSGISRWNADPSDNNYRDIPMWGETPSQDGTGDKLINSANMSFTNLRLLRMLARINVTVDASATPPVTGVFKLTHVYLYNLHQQGRIVPDISALDAAGSALKVNSPTLVAGSSVVPGPLEYITHNTASFTNTIYTFESAVPYDVSKNAELSKMTALVIGGIYGSDAKSTYYRVNLLKADGGYFDLLRNYSYNITVTKVKGSGCETPDEAFSSGTVNMEASVVDWDDGEAGEVAIDGKYLLSIRPDSQLAFYRESGSRTINITTDHPDGWRITKITEANGTTPIPANGWFTSNIAANVAQGSDGSTVPLTLTVTENSSGASRTGYVYLRFGRTDTRITVTQSSVAAPVSITASVGGIPVSELLFNGSGSDSKTLDIAWIPQNADLKIANAAIIGATAFPSASGLPSDGTVVSAGNGGTGQISYAIRPPAFTDNELAANPFLERSSLLTLSCSGVTRSFPVRQINYTVSPVDVKPYYGLNGNTYSFSIRSNASWRIKSVEEYILSGTGPFLALKPSDNLKAGTSGGINMGSGIPLTFTVSNNSTLKGGVYVNLESTDPFKKFNNVVSLILYLSGEYYPDAHKGWAGSNIYFDGSKLTFDDVGVTTHKMYQGVYFKWGSLYGISPMGDYNASSTLIYPPKGGSQISTFSWTSIPHVDDQAITGFSDKSKRDRAYLYEITDGPSGIGDICKWLTDKLYAPGSSSGKKWRMPTSNEFEPASSYSDWVFGTEGTANASGTTVISSGRSKSDIGEPFFPASGSRYHEDGRLRGNLGYYWSSSPLGTYAYYLSFYQSGSVSADFTMFRNYGSPVRCVLDGIKVGSE